MEAPFLISAQINASPDLGDVALVSIDSGGNFGSLNQMVLNQYGYVIQDLPNESALIDGHFWLHNQNRKPILFIVTIGNGVETVKNLAGNLEKAFFTYKEYLQNKVLWIPLMGTGTGQLEYKTSFDTTFNLIVNFIDEISQIENIIISLPDDISSTDQSHIANKLAEGEEFLVNKSRPLISILEELKINPTSEEFRSFYLADYVVGTEDRLDEFIEEGFWNTEQNKLVEPIVNLAKNGDVVLLRTVDSVNLTLTLRIQAIGVINDNPQNGYELKINWTRLRVDIEDSRNQYVNPFVEINKDSISSFLGKIIDSVVELPSIIASLTQSVSSKDANILNYNIASIKSVIKDKIDSGARFWWLQAKTKRWKIVKLKIGQTKEYNSRSSRGRLQPYFKNLVKGDFLIGYQGSPDTKIIGLFVVDKVDLNDKMTFRLIYLFKRTTDINELIKIPDFKDHRINTVKTGSIFELKPELFQEIINTTELGESSSNVSGYDPTQYSSDYEGADEPTVKTSSESTKDKIPFHYDRVVDDDQLGREPVAIAFTDLVKHDIFTQDLNHAFMVHLQGEWGAGKSTFLNLIKKNLNSEERKWVVVEYNAWKNQHLTPPWWIFIDQIYQQVKTDAHFKDKRKLKWRELLRRIKYYTGWQKVFALAFTFTFIGLLIVFGNSILDFFANKTLSNDSVDNMAKGLTFDVFVKLIISLGSLVGLIFSLSKFLSTPFFLNSSKEAISFMERASDPLKQIKDHFKKLVCDINKNHQLAIFIDDIDRCDRAFLVELLEGVQTLFKEEKVLYIVAGDKQWISTSFQNQYKEFETEHKSKENNLGDLFLRKAFQLSIRMPLVSPKYKKQFWDYILGIEESNEPKPREIKDLDKTEKEQFEKEVLAKSDEDMTNPEVLNDMEEKFNISSDAMSNIAIGRKNAAKKELQHLLRDFHPLLETNPRSIIRLANFYTMTRSTLIAERKNPRPNLLFRWLILKEIYPAALGAISVVMDIEAFKTILAKSNLSQAMKDKCVDLIDGADDQESLTVDIIKDLEGI